MTQENNRERKTRRTESQPAIAPLTDVEIRALPARLPHWPAKSVDGIDRLERTFFFSSYRAGVAFANRLGDLAETSNHHPAILIEVDRVTVSWWTFSTGGLTPADATMAEKTDRLYESMTMSETEHDGSAIDHRLE